MHHQIFSLSECYGAMATLEDFGYVIGIGVFRSEMISEGSL